MSTDAQFRANQQNAQHSTGPKTEEGKAASCMNNFRHGFTGAFTVLPSEDQDEFDHLLCGLRAEHQPTTMTEKLLVDKMAQAHWLSLRAQRLQDITMADDLPLKDQERQFALFLRYQTTNDRAFHRALHDLLKLKAERRGNEIGFESQKQKAAAESRRDSAEKRRQELHEFAVLLAEAKLDHQLMLNSSLESDRKLAAASENHLREAQQAA
jgi:hypothetical protein